MIVKELISPDSIVVVGASDNLSKPGGRMLHNIIKGGYDGKLIGLNPKKNIAQGVPCVNHTSQLDGVDLAIIAVASKYVPEIVEVLAKEKGTKAFIILSAGFSEIGPEGKKLEERVVEIIDGVNGTLIGPNCIGILTPSYNGVFAGPIPKLEHKGCDFVSSSGATAAFFLETAIPMGITFASLFSVGNSAQTGVEDVLEYWDETFDPETSSHIKLIYIEQVGHAAKFLRHTASLINKGCNIAAIKAGRTDAGSRAVSSHTGALAGSDEAIDALFNKAGITRCYGREEMAYVAGVFAHVELKGNRLAIITHAGGPGVMLTDRLVQSGLETPCINGPAAEELKTKLFHGSSVANPIDFLATGTAEQLGVILDYVENRFDNIDGAVVIYGTSGLFDVKDVYRTLNRKMLMCKKPVYPVMASVIQAKDAMTYFISKGRIAFQDEVNFGAALAKVYHTPKPAGDPAAPPVDKENIRNIIDNAGAGYLKPAEVCGLLDAAGITRAKEIVARRIIEAMDAADETGFPLVMKVVGPLHKSDVNGITLNVKSLITVKTQFDRMMKIDGAEGVLFQPMLDGMELFAGAKYEAGFGHIVLCGLGGVFVETLKDVASGLSPLGMEKALSMIRSLNAYELIKGARGHKGVNEELFAEVITRLSALLENAPEIQELDLNPLLGKEDALVVVDARIRIGF